MIERSCERCGQTFQTWPAEIRKGGGRFCSRECGTKARTSSIEERFWPKVKKTRTCWLWIGANNGQNGTRKWPYGLLGSKHGQPCYKAHWVSWELHNGPVPNGMHVLHKCDVTLCVNPEHLFLGTHADNMRDKVVKGRAKGGRPKGSKLSPESLISFRRKRGYNP